MLKPLWIFSQKGNLWRFFITDIGIVVGETRDLEKKIVYFFSLEIGTGKINFQNLILGSYNYWISIEGYDSNYIYLHRFENPNMPDHIGIIAIDIFTGEIKWENKDLIYFFNSDEELYGYRQMFESLKYYLIDKENGNVKKEIRNENSSDIQSLKSETSENQYIHNKYTDIFNLDTSNNDIREIISKELEGKVIQGEVEYIKQNDLLIFNYHIRSSEKSNADNILLDNILCVYEIADKNKVLHQKINHNVRFNVPDSFFIHKNYLVYVIEKKEISVIKL
ncbi:MAG TPA: DUF4905 domain-containing protein [Ignavibacteria bacterium]